jgi:putative ABC transport system substrate-binding protein
MNVFLCGMIWSLIRITVLALALFHISCGGNSAKKKYRVAFLDAFEDATLAQAKKGFFVALKDSGFSPETNLEVLYRNAQGDIPALTQSVDYFIAQQVDLIASNSTLSTVSAAKKTNKIPICMMVSPSPEIAGLVDKTGKPQGNLFGVYETLEYIDTAFTLINELRPGARKVGTIINQSEPQSVDALKRIEAAAARAGLELIVLPASSSADTRLITEQLASKGIDVFFALPDNTIFASFETIAAVCKGKNIPILTSEAGLMARGANMAFGADIYQWGYDAGCEAVKFLKTGKLPLPIKVKTRKICNVSEEPVKD